MLRDRYRLKEICFLLGHFNVSNNVYGDLVEGFTDDWGWLHGGNITGFLGHMLATVTPLAGFSALFAHTWPKEVLHYTIFVLFLTTMSCHYRGVGDSNYVFTTICGYDNLRIRFFVTVCCESLYRVLGH